MLDYHKLFIETHTGVAIHQMLFDTAGRPVDYLFLDVNPAFERLTGLARGDVIGRPATEVIPGLEHYWIERYGMVVLSGISDCFEAEARSLGHHYMAVAFRTAPGQFAVQFYSTSRVHELQADLLRAYDETLEGWARAMDLRDHFTEGHSRRVVDNFARLAVLCGIVDPEDLKAHRAGAFLHDLGKIGIPDSILLKPGPLTPEERLVMEQHPVTAYGLLAPISYLARSLDIPYCHHEAWDGSGYPRKLAGEAIPLAARVFTVVDVWDAITQPRVYRPAVFPRSTAAEIILSEAGRKFEPAIVRVFLDNISLFAA